MKINRWSSVLTFCLAAVFMIAGCNSSANKNPVQSAAANTDDLIIYSGGPLESWHITIADFESQQIMTGKTASVPRSQKVPDSRVSARVSQKANPARETTSTDDALSLDFKNSWYANLRLEGGTPLDLRPYIAQGVLAFDLNVVDLAKGGLAVKLNCGKNCERKVPYLLPARAFAGKGWQHIVFSMSCFAREGDDFSAVTQPFALDASGSGEVAVANVKFQKTGTPNAECPNYKTVSVTPDLLNESWSIDWWLPRHEQKLQEIKTLKADHKKIDLIFIGDSITHGWEKDGFNVWNKYYAKYNAVDLGFGGDRTENILWRLQHGEVDGIDPKVAVLMFGTNNTGHRMEDPNTTALGIKRNIEELQQRLPNTKILLLAIFPRDAKPDGQMRQINNSVNNIISGFADNKKIFFLNINQVFLDKDGVLSTEIMPDLLHPNEYGYQLWAKAMEPTLKQLLTKH